MKGLFAIGILWQMSRCLSLFKQMGQVQILPLMKGEIANPLLWTHTKYVIVQHTLKGV